MRKLIPVLAASLVVAAPAFSLALEPVAPSAPQSVVAAPVVVSAEPSAAPSAAADAGKPDAGAVLDAALPVAPSAAPDAAVPSAPPSVPVIEVVPENDHLSWLGGLAALAGLIATFFFWKKKKA